MNKPSKKDALLGISDMIWKIARQELWRYPPGIISLDDVYQIGMLKASRLYDDWDFDRCKFTTTRTAIWGHIVSAARTHKKEDFYHFEYQMMEESGSSKMPLFKNVKSLLFEDPDLPREKPLNRAINDALGELTPRMADVVRSKVSLGGFTRDNWFEKYSVSHTIYNREWKKAKDVIQKNHPELLEYYYENN